MSAKNFLIALALLLSGCGGDEGATSSAVILLPASSSPTSTTPSASPTSSAPPATPSPPSPPPTSAPPATPSPPSPPPVAAAGDGKIVVVTEGDSIAVTWGGNHTGMYGSSRSDIEFHGLAVGGSGLINLISRIDAVLAFKPDLVSVHIGANDLASYATAQAYADALKVYVDQIRATGAKVVVTTVLPQQLGDASIKHNALRKELANIIKSANWIDGVADFAADTAMGPDSAPFNLALYSDGLHPTDGTQGVGEGGQVKLFRIFKPAMDKLAIDVR